jgi:hypothetical protein
LLRAALTVRDSAGWTWLDGWPSSEKQRNHKQHEKYYEQDMGNPRGRSRDSSKTKNSGDDRNN